LTWRTLHFGRIDVLVNNAGGQFPQRALDYSVKGWKAVVDNNLNGTWYMMHAIARRWRDTGTQGNIVNIVPPSSAECRAWRTPALRGLP
jgi:citronellol/citronellal dehydrogenase